LAVSEIPEEFKYNPNFFKRRNSHVKQNYVTGIERDYTYNRYNVPTCFL